MPTVSPHRPSSRRAVLRLLLLGAVLAVYVLLLAAADLAGAHAARWLRLTVPSVWLLAAALVLAARGWGVAALGPPPSSPWAAAARTALLAVLAVAVGLAPALLPAGPGAGSSAQLAQAVLLVALVPLAEERFFRDVLLAEFVRRFGGRGLTGLVLPIALVSALFGLLHRLAGLELAMAGLSVALCVAALGWRRVAPAVAIHTAWNAFVVVGDLADGAARWGVAAVAAAGLLGLAVASHLAGRRRTAGETP